MVRVNAPVWRRAISSQKNAFRIKGKIDVKVQVGVLHVADNPSQQFRRAPFYPPSPNPDEPVAYERVRTWLLEAERLAGLPKQQGSLWHAFRRGWATSRKHLSLKDTAAAGGWASTETLLRCYQQPDDETRLAVVLGGAELREWKAL